MNTQTHTQIHEPSRAPSFNGLENAGLEPLGEHVGLLVSDDGLVRGCIPGRGI